MRLRVIVAIPLLLPFVLAACDRAGTPVTTPSPSATPRLVSHTPHDAEVWGGFLFAVDSASITVTPTPPPVQSDESFEGYPISGLPGYRQFPTPDELATFLGQRAAVLAPASLPAGAQLIDAYAVLLSDGRVAMVGLEYRYADSDAPAGDPDLWIVHDFRTPRPLVEATGKPPGYPDSLGRDASAPVAVDVAGRRAIYLGYDSPPALARSLVLRSALSWFDDDGSFWSVQARRLDASALVAIAASLTPVAPQ